MAASSQWRDADGVRQPGGEAHAWIPGGNQTVCGLPLSRTGLIRFPHVPFDLQPTDVVLPGDEIRYICPRCLAGTGNRPGQRAWRRTAPRP